eukprot:7386265-Prymnesium_polylepis.1
MERLVRVSRESEATPGLAPITQERVVCDVPAADPSVSRPAGPARASESTPSSLSYLPIHEGCVSTPLSHLSQSSYCGPVSDSPEQGSPKQRVCLQLVANRMGEHGQ